MTQNGDLVRWTGEINQPDIHHMYRSNFNAVDVHNKLSVGPRSVCKVATGSLPLKLWLYLVACAETNAYLMYMHHHKLSSEQYNQANLKFDLEGELLQCALEDGAVSAEARVCTRRGGDGMASGATHTGEQSVPASFQGHARTHVQGKHHKCMACGDRTKWFCGCGRAICGTQWNKTCYPWHMQGIISGILGRGLCSGHVARRHGSEHLTCLS
jgi:hypothetical protein